MKVIKVTKDYFQTDDEKVYFFEPLEKEISQEAAMSDQKMSEINEIKEHICSKIRLAVAEYGAQAVENAVLIGPYDYWDQVTGLVWIYAPTACSITLGRVDGHVARFFEDAYPDWEVPKGEKDNE